MSQVIRCTGSENACGCADCFPMPPVDVPVPRVDSLITPINVPAGAETKIVTLDRDHAGHHELGDGWVPIATWHDIGVVEVTHVRPGARSYSSNDADRRITRHLAPVRSMLLARNSEIGIGAAKAEATKAKHDMYLAQNERDKLKSELANLAKKIADEGGEATKLAAELALLRPVVAKIERHMGAVREAIGSARFTEITSKSDSDNCDSTPF